MNKAMKILLGAEAFFTLVTGMIGPLYAIYVEKIGGDILTATAALATFSFVLGGLIYIFGKYQDKINNDKLMIVAGYSIKCIGFLGYIFVTNIIHLFIVEVILAIGYATTYPAYNSLYSKNIDKGKSCSNWGAYEGLTNIVYAVGVLAAGALVTLAGFKTLFVVMFIFSLIGLIVASRLMFNSPKDAVKLLANKCAKLKIVQMFL